MKEPCRHFFKRHQVSRVAFKINRSFHWNKPIYSKFKEHRAHVFSLLFLYAAPSTWYVVWAAITAVGCGYYRTCLELCSWAYVWASLMSATVKQRCLGILTLTSGSWVSGSTEMLRAASRQWWDHGVDILSFTNVCKHALVSDKRVLKVKWGNIWCCWPTSSCWIISPREWLRLQEKPIVIIIIICEICK